LNPKRGYVGLAELVLGIALVFGLMRKLSYLSGIFLSLLIWTVDEGFGGPCLDRPNRLGDFDKSKGW
jgi:uncharacterized membrane protein YphA (DoxX/SURF4 family)